MVCIIDTMDEAEQESYITIVVGVSGGVMAGLLLGMVATVFLLVSIRRKKSSRRGLVIGKKHCRE